MHAYTSACLATPIHTHKIQTHSCMSTYIKRYLHAYSIYVRVVGMNMNAAGMSIHPFQWNFYVLVGKYLHYSIFDDVITLHH